MGKIESMKQENHSNDEEENNVSNISSVDGNGGSVSSSVHGFSGSRMEENIQKHSSSKPKKRKRISYSSPKETTMSPPRKRVCVSTTFKNKAAAIIKTPSVSTKLCIYDQTWSIKDSKPDQIVLSPAEMIAKMVAYNIGLMKNYLPGEEEAEKRIGVSTKLSLFNYPWKITKILTDSDLGNLSRLLVRSCLVERHIKPYLEGGEEVMRGGGLRVSVWDCDTNSMHSLVFKYWESSKSYVFIGHWGSDFVRRRELGSGDQIGMCWDSFNSRFNFSVLNRRCA